MTQKLRIGSWLPPLAIAASTFAAFAPCLKNGFVWDDQLNFIANLHYRGLGLSHLRWIVTNTYVGPYQPVSWLSSAIDYTIWGLKPFGYHLDNLLLHCANAVLAYSLALRLLAPEKGRPIDRKLAAVCAALAFSLHPLRVEAVAWATERRTLLAGLFYLWAALSYLRTFDRGVFDARAKLRVSILFALALLSKGISIALPATLLLLDIYPLRRMSWEPSEWHWDGPRSVFREKAPLFLLAAAFAAAEIMAYMTSVGLPGLRVLPLAWRISQSFMGTSLYLAKTLLPIGLSPMYEIPVRPTLWQWPAVLGAILVIQISAILWVYRHEFPGMLALWVHYLLALAPVCGLLQVSNAIAADRYTYIACMGWALFPGWLVLQRRAWVVPAAMGLAALSFLTWRQTSIWRDDESLWTHALALNSDSSTARNNLANVYLTRDETDRATELYKAAFALNPDNLHACNNLAATYLLKHDFAQAERYYRIALSMDQNAIPAHNGLALALAQQGRLDDAIEQYRIAIRMDPKSEGVRFNFGQALAARGRLGAARAQYKAALAINPDFAPARQALERLSSLKTIR